MVYVTETELDALDALARSELPGALGLFDLVARIVRAYPALAAEVREYRREGARLERVATDAGASLAASEMERRMLADRVAALEARLRARAA